MATTIAQTSSDTESTIADKVRNLPANQGLNNIPMWIKIDAEIAQSRTDGKITNNTNRTDKHGN